MAGRNQPVVLILPPYFRTRAICNVEICSIWATSCWAAGCYLNSPGDFIFNARVRMHLVEVLEGCSHLRHHRPCVGQVHAAHVVALECDEALGYREGFAYTSALRAANKTLSSPDWGCAFGVA